MRDDEELEELMEQQFDDQELEIAKHHCAVVYVHMCMLNPTVLRIHLNQGYIGWFHLY